MYNKKGAKYLIMADIFSQSKKMKEQLVALVNETIESHPMIKSAIKSKVATVVQAPDTSSYTVQVQFPFDNTVLTLPYNPKIPVDDLSVGKNVSVWYSHSIQNAIVMNNAQWTD